MTFILLVCRVVYNTEQYRRLHFCDNANPENIDKTEKRIEGVIQNILTKALLVSHNIQSQVRRVRKLLQEDG
jgi:hypothetical protein